MSARQLMDKALSLLESLVSKYDNAPPTKIGFENRETIMLQLPAALPVSTATVTKELVKKTEIEEDPERIINRAQNALKFSNEKREIIRSNAAKRHSYCWLRREDCSEFFEKTQPSFKTCDLLVPTGVVWLSAGEKRKSLFVNTNLHRQLIKVEYGTSNLDDLEDKMLEIAPKCETVWTVYLKITQDAFVKGHLQYLQIISNREEPTSYS